ncbi:MAG: hypothetical protein AB1705_02725 [Verrucomicrobiota bacterium]
MGIISATYAAVPLGQFVKPIVKLAGLTGLVGQTFMAPFAVYCTVVICFSLMGHAIYEKVDLYYKYKTSDDKCVMWQRMHIQTGLCLGLLLGMVLLVSVGTAIYGAGYMTRQATPIEKPSGFQKFINTANEDLRKTGLEKIVAAVEPYPDRWYHLADSIGLLYANPQLKTRLLDYPFFMNYSESPEFKWIVTNADFNAILQKKTSVVPFFAHSNVVAFARNPANAKALQNLNLKDLREYLETGKSSAYANEKIIGKWDIDINATIPQISRNVGDLKVAAQIKRILILYAVDIYMVATPDGQVYLKGGSLEFNQLNALLEARSPGKLPPPPNRPAAGDGEVPLPNNIMSKGNWKRDGDSYKITFTVGEGSNVEGTATMHTDDVLKLEVNKGALTFTRMQ